MNKTRQLLPVIIIWLILFCTTKCRAGFVVQNHSNGNITQTVAAQKTVLFQRLKHSVMMPMRHHYYHYYHWKDRSGNYGNSFRGFMTLLCGIAAFTTMAVGLFYVFTYVTGALATTGALMIAGALGVGILGIILGRKMKYGAGYAGLILAIIAVCALALVLAIAGAINDPSSINFY